MDGRNKQNSNATVIREVEPELYAQKCPTCNGFGTLKYGAIVCNGCDGKTWILVPVRKDGWNNGEPNK